MNIEDAGEFELIRQLQELIGPDPGLLVGIGDDTCAWQNGPDKTLATIDSLVEGVHFRHGFTSWYELGWKALAVNLSDIAAMGGKAGFALVALSLVNGTEVENVLDLYRGILELGSRFGISIAGGNISRAPVTSITITVIGSAGPTGNLLLRSGALAGQAVAVTGFPGSAAAGLKLIEAGKYTTSNAATSLLQAFRKPFPRLKEGEALVQAGVTTAIDISDGLLADLEHILKASKASAVIDADSVPVEGLMKASFSRSRALEMALTGGEDYELLFTANKAALPGIVKRMEVPVTIIGEIVTGSQTDIKLTGDVAASLTSFKKGWQHFG